MPVKPYLPPYRKTKVYRFGSLWFWRCKDLRCEQGGRARVWDDAIARANEHAATHGSPR